MGGGGNGIHPLSERLFQHYSETTFLQTFVIDKCVTICIVKLGDRPCHVAMAVAHIKGVNNNIFEKNFFLSTLTLEMETATINYSTYNERRSASESRIIDNMHCIVFSL